MSYRGRPGLMPTPIPFAPGMYLVPLPGMSHVPQMMASVFARTPQMPLQLPVPSSSTPHDPIVTYSAPPVLFGSSSSTPLQRMNNNISDRGKQNQVVSKVETEPTARIMVFIGNINPCVPPRLMISLLKSCGPVISWKPVKTFGYCEYGSAEEALRCIRLLHDKEIGGQRLVVKVDAKTQLLLDKYQSDQRGRANPMCKGSEHVEAFSRNTYDYLNEAQRAMDVGITALINRHTTTLQDEINSYDPSEIDFEKTNRMPDDAELEDEKKHVIQREIEKFRSTTKRHKSWRKEIRKLRNNALDSSSGSRNKSREIDEYPARKRDHDRDLERDQDRDRDRERDRDRDHDRDRDKNQERDGHRVREGDRDRDRDSVRDRDRDKDHDRDRDRDQERDRDRDQERDRDRDQERDRDRNHDRDRDSDYDRDGDRDHDNDSDTDDLGELERERERERDLYFRTLYSQRR